ncbi:unnamed protein product, partial [Rotaria sp. Silwood1]
MEYDQISKIYFKNKKFVIDLSSVSNPITTLSCNFININLINQHIDPTSFCNPSTIINTDRNSANSMDVNAINKLNLSATDIQIFLNFVENIITSEPSHRGYVHSYVRGTLNKNLLFFNIA